MLPSASHSRASFRSVRSSFHLSGLSSRSPSDQEPFHLSAPDVLIHDFLGFTRLMDLRCLSRSTCVQMEIAALQWMERHLPKTLLREEAERQAAQAAKDAVIAEVDRRYASLFATAPLFPSTTTRPANDPAFSHGDAVWLRQTLSRWRFVKSCDDTHGCLISRQLAEGAYEAGWFDDVHLSTKMNGTADDSRVRVIDLAGHMLRLHGHAECLDRRYTNTGWGHGANRWALQEIAQRRTAESLKASLTAPPLFALLPHAITLHSILPLFDLEALLLLRALNRSFQSLAEQTACAWMSRRFPAGLRTMTRQLEEATRGRPLVSKGWKRKRPGQDVKVGVVPATSAHRKSSSLSLASSSSPSPLLLSPPSPSLSYTITDVVWLMQQKAWARSLIQSTRALNGLQYGDDVPLICQSHGLSRFPIQTDQWCCRFGSPVPLPGSSGLTRRYSVMTVVDFILATFGSGVKVREELRQKAKRAQHRRDVKAEAKRLGEERKARLMEAAKTALKEVGLEAKFDTLETPHSCSFVCEGLKFQLEWQVDLDRPWRYRGGAPHSIPKGRYPWDEGYERRMRLFKLHIVMVRLGMECAHGQPGKTCGWGGCRGLGKSSSWEEESGGGMA